MRAWRGREIKSQCQAGSAIPPYSFGAQHLGGAVELAEQPQRGTEPDEGAGEFVGRQAERDGLFVARQGLRSLSEHVMRPGDLIDDLGDVGEALVEFLQAREDLGGLAVRPRTDDGIEFIFP